MVKIPSATNSLNPLGVFVQRKVYEDQYPKGSIPATLDLRVADKLYGKVDKRSNAVLPKEEKLKLIENDVFALGFVADAFDAMKKHVKDGVFLGKIQNVSKYSKMEARVGWKNPRVLYHEYQKILYKVFSEKFIPNNGLKNKIIDFDGFLHYFFIFLETLKNYPFLFSSFIYSNLCPNNVSGLVVEIEQENFSEDKKKFNAFISDKNFYAISKIAEKFGFFLDKNAPWRFIANIGSNRMEKYFQPYFFSLDTIFGNLYNRSSNTDQEFLKVYLIQMYNSWIAFETDRNDRKPVQVDQVNDSTWFMIQTKIKMIEIGSGDPSRSELNKKVLDRVMNKCLLLLNAGEKDLALDLLYKQISYSNNNVSPAPEGLLSLESLYVV